MFGGMALTAESLDVFPVVGATLRAFDLVVQLDLPPFPAGFALMDLFVELPEELLHRLRLVLSEPSQR